MRILTIGRRRVEQWPGLSALPSMMLGGLAALFFAFWSPPASAAGPYFELVEIVPDNVGADTRWTVSDGHMSQSDLAYNSYHVEYSWSPPPRTSDSAGFDVTLNIEGKSSPNRIYSGVGMYSPTGSFTFDKDPVGVDVSVPDAAPGGSDSRSASISIHVTPTTTAGDGSIIELKIGAYYAYGVTYRYRVSETPVIGGEDGGDDGGDDPGDEGPLAVSVDCPTDIVIGRLPSLNCHLLISGFRRNTADPVEVLVPDMLDQFGNHANGIQVVDLDGAEDVYNWDSPHSWGFFVFACTGPNIGANCYDSMAVPGPAAIRVIVQQKGLQPVELTLTFNVLAGNGGSLGGVSQDVVRIGSRWIVGGFVNIESGPPVDSGILLDWLSARWTLDPVDNGNVRIHSAWKPDVYLHAQNGYLEAGPIQPDWQSALWQVESAPDAFYILFRNVGQGTYLNIAANGGLEINQIGSDQVSAHWWLLR